MGFPNALSVEHHASGHAIDRFTHRFGSRCEKLSREEKLHLIGAIALTLQLQITESDDLTIVDGMGEHPFICSHELDAAARILEADSRALSGLLAALANQINAI